MFETLIAAAGGPGLSFIASEGASLDCAPYVEKSPDINFEVIENTLLPCEQVPMPLTHLFAPGICWREIFMPKGTIVLGHEHKTKHFNVILAGIVSVLVDGEWMKITAPNVFISTEGVRKLLYIHEDCRWACPFPTHTTDIPELEAEFIIKTETFLTHEEKNLIGKLQALKNE